MFLLIALFAGLSGGIIAWFSLIYRILYHALKKRRLKTPAQMTKELAGYEGITPAEPDASDIMPDMPEPDEPHPDDAELEEQQLVAEQLQTAVASVPDAERINYINNIIANIARIKEERTLINTAAEEYRTAILLCPDIDIAAVTKQPPAATPEPAAPAPPPAQKEPALKKRKEFIIEEL